MRSVGRVIWVAMMVITTVGCATVPVRKENRPGGVECAIFQLYSGPRLPSNELACISSTCGRFYNGVQIRRIDRWTWCGVPFFVISMDGWEEFAHEVLPGTHDVEVRYQKFEGGWVTTSVTNRMLRFTAEAGHTYRLKCETDESGGWLLNVPKSGQFSGNKTWNPYIEDGATGVRVPSVFIDQ